MEARLVGPVGSGQNETLPGLIFIVFIVVRTNKEVSMKQIK